MPGLELGMYYGNVHTQDFGSTAKRGKTRHEIEERIQTVQKFGTGCGILKQIQNLKVEI